MISIRGTDHLPCSIQHRVVHFTLDTQKLELVNNLTMSIRDINLAMLGQSYL
jgi:hypothetical protein